MDRLTMLLETSRINMSPFTISVDQTVQSPFGQTLRMDSQLEVEDDDCGVGSKLSIITFQLFMISLMSLI